MHIFKTRDFHDWAVHEGLTDAALQAAVEEVVQGLIDASLGGHVFKKRVAIRGRGKRGGLRTLIAYQQDDKAFFMYGFTKKQRANITSKELKALKLLARQLLGYSAPGLAKAVKSGDLIEVN